MEDNMNAPYHKATFTGTGGQLFAIQIINVILTIITLGLYYPWARVNLLRFVYQETEFMGTHFTFHGTGREVFMGFIKVFALFVILGLMIAFGGILGVLIAYAAIFFLIVPMAIHGSLKYRMSRTSWRGIYFGYRGDLVELMKICAKGLLLTFITFGIYGAWFQMDLRRYTVSHLRAGSAKFGFDGEGGEFFRIFFVGYLLTLITFGIYGFWWFRDIFNYNADHTFVELDDKEYSFRGTATAGKVFELVFINNLLIMFTLGIGTPWAIVRQIKFNYNNMILEGDFNPDSIEQTEEDYGEAAGETLIDFLNIDFI